MKFSWGTGILIFLIIFILAAAGFIFFAMRQDVNLVHEDYYEKGVDHSAQMEVDARSQVFKDAVQPGLEEGSLVVHFSTSLAASIDSGNVLLYRPSDRNLDTNYPLDLSGNAFKIPKTDLAMGRYILKLEWYSGGLEYNVDKAVEIR
jgi:hypothetical protein